MYIQTNTHIHFFFGALCVWNSVWIIVSIFVCFRVYICIFAILCVCVCVRVYVCVRAGDRQPAGGVWVLSDQRLISVWCPSPDQCHCISNGRAWNTLRSVPLSQHTCVRVLAHTDPHTRDLYCTAFDRRQIKIILAGIKTKVRIVCAPYFFSSFHLSLFLDIPLSLCFPLLCRGTGWIQRCRQLLMWMLIKTWTHRSIHINILSHTHTRTSTHTHTHTCWMVSQIH